MSRPEIERENTNISQRVGLCRPRKLRGAFVPYRPMPECTKKKIARSLRTSKGLPPNCSVVYGVLMPSQEAPRIIREAAKHARAGGWIAGHRYALNQSTEKPPRLWRGAIAAAERRALEKIELMKLAQELYAEDVAVPEVARIVGRAYVTVQRWMRREWLA